MFLRLLVLDFLCLGLGFRQRRQQHTRQNGDDGDHDQQLDERESAYFRFFQTLVHTLGLG